MKKMNVLNDIVYPSGKKGYSNGNICLIGLLEGFSCQKKSSFLIKMSYNVERRGNQGDSHTICLYG